MKKVTIRFIGAMTVLSLTACAPTAPKETPTQSIETTGTKGSKMGKVPDPNAPELDPVPIYSGNDDTTELVMNMEGIEELDAQHIIDLPISAGVLEEGTAVSSLEVAGDEKAGPGVEAAGGDSGERIETLDLSKVLSSGTSGEMVILSSIGNTFIESFELGKLKLLVDDKSYSSDHIEHGDDGHLISTTNYEKL